MALSKASSIDKIIIRSPYNNIELRTATVIVEDDTPISLNYSHETVELGKLNSSNELVDTDMSGYSTEIQGVAAAVWTNDVKTKFKEYLIAKNS
tara:strand:+ start:246 stop:527 length:282 start_codon:yes stop_codon:yes gene_type:complete